MIEKLGVQLFTVRDFMKTPEELRETFRKLKAIGYDQGQTAGCAVPYAEFGQIAKEEGFEIVGTHDNFDRMYEDFEASYADHQLLGTKIMGIGGYFKDDPKDFEEFIRKANIVGAKIGALGGKFTYHNHSGEFMKLSNGKNAMEMLEEGLDPATTSFCLDTCWVQRGGADVRYWIERLTNRIDILHLKDVARGKEGEFITEICNGNLYWEGIFESAAKANVKYYVVEQDTCPGDPFESLKMSSDYIHKNFMK